MSVSVGKIFLWSSTALAALTFAGAILAGATWASRFREGADDGDRYDELLQEALEKHDAGDLDGAGKLYGRLLAVDPQDPVVRANLGRIDKSRGDLARAVAEHKVAISAAPDMPDLYYNVACYYALSKRKEEAITWLGMAFDHGFGRLALLATDPDLASLHGDPRFELLAKTGKLPNGLPHLRLSAAPAARKGKPFEVTLVVERDLPADGAPASDDALDVEWKPEAPLTISRSSREQSASRAPGVTTLRTTMHWWVKSTREGAFEIPPAKVVIDGQESDSESLIVKVGAASGPDVQPGGGGDDDDDQGGGE